MRDAKQRTSLEDASDPASPTFNSARYPFAYVTRVSSRYDAFLSARLKAIGLDQPTWRILMILTEASPSTVGELVDRIAVKQPTLTRIVQRMRRDGLVVTASRPTDQRIVEVSITEAGRSAVERSRPLASTAFRRGVKGLTQAEVNVLIGLLSRIESNFADR